MIRFSQLTIEILSGGNYGIAIWNNSDANPKISSSYITLRGLQYNYGIYNTLSSPVIQDVTVEVALGSIRNIAIHSDASSPVINNVQAKAESPHSSASVIGLQCLSTSRPCITNSSFEAESTGSDVYGLTINTASSGARITNSRIICGVKDEASGLQCRGLYDENLAYVGC